MNHMPTPAHSLQAAIAALEAQRPTLGDAVVEAALKPLRDQLAALTAFSYERKHVTILFADVSHFTAMSEKLDPEDVTAIMNRCFETLSTEITRHGGTVDKYSGDAVMALFGAPRALENHQEMAVRAALAMQAALAALSAGLERERGFTLRMRIGLNTGEVLAGLVGGVGDKSYTVMGDAVNLASRLEHVCQVGRVMISAATGNPLHAIFDFEPPQQISIPGRTEPVTVYTVVGPKTERGRVRGVAGLFSPMIGREVELRSLQSAYERAVAERRWQAVAVIGEPGIGKTRLRREFLGWLTRSHADARTLTARCYAHTQMTPYHVLSALAQALWGISQDDGAPASLAKLKDGLRELGGEADAVEGRYWLGSAASVLGIPLEDDPLQAMEPQQRLDRILVSMGRILMQAARICPTVVVVEDLHWADDLSLAFLDRLAHLTGQGEAADQAALLIMISRPPEGTQERLAQLLDCVERAPCQVLRPGPLDAAQSTQLLAELIRSADLAAHLQPLILEHAQGNPFFIEELLRLFVDDGTLVHDETSGAWQMARAASTLHAPENVQDVLAARLDRLSPEDKRVAQYAAIIGRTFWQRLLGEVAAQAVDAVLARLEERQLIVRLAESQVAGDWEWAFRHVLMQEVAYASVPRSLRGAVHRQAAEWLERHAGARLEALTPLIANHFYEGEAWAQALAYQLQAGQRAVALFAHETAKKHLERAKGLIESSRVTPGLEQRMACYESLGDVYTVQGHYEAARECYQAVLSRPGIEETAAADIGRKMAQTYERQGQYAAALGWLQRGLEALSGRPDDAVVARICLLLGIINARQGHADQAFVWAERALRAIEGKGALAEEAQACNLMGVVCRSEGQLELAAEYCRHSAELYEALNNRLKAAAAYNNLGVVAFERDDWPGAEAAGRQALKLQESTDDAYGQATTHCNLADLYRRLGQLKDAEAHAKAGLRLAQAMGSAYLQALAHENLAVVLLRQGKPGQDALEHLSTSWRLLEGNDIQELCSEVQGLLAETYLREGKLDEAAGAARQALEIAVEQVAPLDEGVARRMLGRVHAAKGDRRKAERELLASLEVLEGAGRRYETGRTLKELAALYAQDEARHAEADAAGQRAIAIFKELGAGLDLEEAQAWA